ncbi:MAG: DASS family sodium-coupled anion symporter [Acidobacteria bacterium]|nr:DASS family sodium-coupled anion symporter [Acidobacteriota bacterium]
MDLRRLGARAATLALVAGIWFWPVPAGLTVQTWHLFAIFVGSIFAVVAGALPIFTASVFAAGAVILSGTLSPAKAYAGFANGTILLIVIAFLVARAVVKCGLGERLGYLVVTVFGRSTLGLGYSLFLVDAVIAPAFPSNTARGGVLYPIAFSLAKAGGSNPDEATRTRMGAFLMFCGMASLTVSSGLWLTAMAANPVGAEIARNFGLKIDFVSWLVASSVPSLLALATLPVFIYKIFPPEVTKTPDAPSEARAALRKMGSLSTEEKIVAVTFLAMVILWAMSGTLKLDSTAIAFTGLGVFLATNVLTMKDIAQEGEVLATFIWFAVLFSLSAQLNELGFMGYLGERLAGALGGLPWLGAFAVLLVAYILMHYLFVSQTAQMLALFGVFLDVGVKLGVPAGILAFSLLFATNYFSAITPQGSSANIMFAGSGYLTQGELYRLGAIITAFLFILHLVIGTPWLMWVTR